VSPENGVVTVETGPGLLAVTDDGPGLDAADLERAFDRYVVHDRHRTDMRRAGGVGLGLALVKELTEAMGGSVKAEPTPGGGATFTVRLPADALPTPGGSPGGSSPAT
jgi:signal transduction histidine kinase